ncbi:hypothetical protein [Brenneria goodwinii]|uniref:hypothetical protein n=1 Tax=Brenneria goodwinii TaxID=1109412 RepID=UPI0036F00623
MRARSVPVGACPAEKICGVGNRSQVDDGDAHPLAAVIQQEKPDGERIALADESVQRIEIGGKHDIRPPRPSAKNSGICRTRRYRDRLEQRRDA